MIPYSLRRINHSCRPNAHYVYRASTKYAFIRFSPSVVCWLIVSLASRLSRIYLHTTSSTPLPPSTEVLVSYLDPFEPTSVRQSELLTRYGFTCACPRCSNAAVSDPRSAEIRRLKADVGGWTRGEVGGKEAVKMMERVLVLMDLEGVEAGRGMTAGDLSKIGAGHEE